MYDENKMRNDVKAYLKKNKITQTEVVKRLTDKTILIDNSQLSKILQGGYTKPKTKFILVQICQMYNIPFSL